MSDDVNGRAASFSIEKSTIGLLVSVSCDVGGHGWLVIPILNRVRQVWWIFWLALDVNLAALLSSLYLHLILLIFCVCCMRQHLREGPRQHLD